MSLSFAASISAPAPHLRLRAVARSGRGLVREINEDVAVARPDLGLYLVANARGGLDNASVVLDRWSRAV